MSDLISRQAAIDAIERKKDKNAKGEKRMKWNEFDNSANLSFAADGQVQTDIECSVCGKKILWDSRVVLTSLPPKYCYWCSCGWSGNSYRKWGKE